jgi:lysophospholipase L1-like esterase
MRHERRLYSLAIAASLLVIFEGGARMLGPWAFPEHRLPATMPAGNDPTMADDVQLGWLPRVGQSTAFGAPGGAWINRHHMRGPEITTPKPSGERRVLVVGDSTVFGVMVADTDTFLAQTETELQTIDPGIRLLNGGVPGWSSVQSRRALETLWADTAPDLLVIASLWSDSRPADLPDALRFGRQLPSILEASRSFVALRAWVRQARWGNDPETVRVDLSPARQGPPPGGRAGPAGGKPPEPLTVRVPLNDYAASLDALADRAEGIGAKVAYLVLPCVRDPGGGPIGDARDTYRERMREAARARNAPLADAPPRFVEGRAQDLFYDDVHPTVAGHARLAGVLTEALRPWAATR